MTPLSLADRFNFVRHKLWQARYLLEIVNECGPASDEYPEEKRRYFLFTDLLADVLEAACESADSFESALVESGGGQPLRPGSSATTAEPSTSSAPSAPVNPMCSRNNSAESSTATTGSI